jgi:hypothetical protein
MIEKDTTSDTNGTGYIKLYRQIMENEFYFSERFTKMAAWMDLLLLARHSRKPALVSIRGNLIKVNRSQLCYSVLSLAKRWKWNRRTVVLFLSHLETRQMIHHRKNHITTVITILNYDKYQEAAQQTAQQKHNSLHTNKNDENGKRKIGPTPPPAEQKISEVRQLVTTTAEELIEKPGRGLYSILGRFTNTLGEDKLGKILQGCRDRGMHFQTEGNLAAYLTKCEDTAAPLNIPPPMKPGTPSWRDG